MNKETKQPQLESSSPPQYECKSIEDPQLESNIPPIDNNNNNDTYTTKNIKESIKDIDIQPKQPMSVPYTINIIPADQEINIPEPIDLMSILNTSERSKSSKTVAFQPYLPRKLKKEITDEEIDEIYENIQMIKSERKKQKVISLQNKNPKSIENLLMRNAKGNTNTNTNTNITPIKCKKPLDQIKDSNKDK